MARPRKLPDVRHLLTQPRNLQWRRHANCIGVPVQIFFSVVDDEGKINRYQTAKYQKQAKELCRACTVREECLKWAIAHQPDGIAGGESARARRRLRKQMRLPDPEAGWEI